jgi:peptidoglycan/xylan/chitin deacetylase (PgdA/CDA1 family)
VPPGGLMPSQVPMFVMFGSDDNQYADGVNWLVDTLFGGKKNPDGSPVQATFFVTAGYGTTDNAGVFIDAGGAQTQADVVNSWKHAYASGHQIGNHSWDHLPNQDGNSRALADWQPEVSKSQDFLINQVGIPACELDTWRFPYLEFDDAGFQAFIGGGFLFDTSVEFGYNWWQPAGLSQGFGSSSPESGKHFWWPYTLDNGFPSGVNDGFDPVETKGVGAHPGVWEFHEHVFNAPDPASPGNVRAVTGLDWNLWGRIAMDKTWDFCATLKYSFEQRYNGNRSPFNIGIHSAIYSTHDSADDQAFANTYDVRRPAMQCFVDYLLSGAFPDVRIVGFHQVIDWMRNPKPIH